MDELTSPLRQWVAAEIGTLNVATIIFRILHERCWPAFSYRMLRDYGVPCGEPLPEEADAVERVMQEPHGTGLFWYRFQEKNGLWPLVEGFYYRYQADEGDFPRWNDVLQYVTSGQVWEFVES